MIRGGIESGDEMKPSVLRKALQYMRPPPPLHQYISPPKIYSSVFGYGHLSVFILTSKYGIQGVALLAMRDTSLCFGAESDREHAPHQAKPQLPISPNHNLETLNNDQENAERYSDCENYSELFSCIHLNRSLVVYLQHRFLHTTLAKEHDACGMALIISPSLLRPNKADTALEKYWTGFSIFINRFKIVY